MTDESASESSPAAREERRSVFSTHDGPSLPAIALVGFMGAGKTTVGRALATRLGWRFEDLDDLIQAREGRSVEQIFHQHGEAAFRNLERLVAHEVLSERRSGPLVLALGGGAFPQESVQEILREARIPAVFLDASDEELFRRSGQQEVIRPLRRDLEQFRQLCEQRRPAYLKAHLCIETGGKEIETVVGEILLRLNLAPNPGSRSGACE